MVHYTEALSDTESEKEQYPETPVEEVSLEKPKRKYTKRVKPDTPPNTPTPEPKPKRVMSDEHKEKMRLAREASKLRRAEAKEAKPVEDKPEAKPVEAKPEDKPVDPPKKKGRPKKVDVVKEVPVKEDVKEAPVKDKVVEVHHHHYEEKPKKEKKERVKKEKKEPPTPKPVMPLIDFV